MTETLISPFEQAHLDGLIALVAAEGWTEYTDDVQRTYRALTAPGVTTLVAIADERVAGAIQVQSGGLIQAHVSMLLIDRNWRGVGLGTRLLREGLERAGGLQLDIRTRTEGYYERLGASRSLGFRLTREDLGLRGAGMHDRNVDQRGDRGCGGPRQAGGGREERWQSQRPQRPRY
jgi:ribosomal protein S18 acetylase RimI-like enzyme